MNEATLNYVRQHADDDVRMLALRGSKDSAVDMAAALQQIAGQQTARRKLPAWAACHGVLYPPHLSMEQCSSEQTARYKAALASQLSVPASLFIDLTGGFGVDFSFMAPHFGRAVYVEQQEELCRLASHNFSTLCIAAETVCADGADYLRNHVDHASLIFLDPARRDAHGGRAYAISDCTPDVLALRDELLQKADFVMLKLSPMLDWRKTVCDLGREWVRQVHIVSVAGECKELLVVLSKAGEGLRLVCVNDDQHWEVPLSSHESDSTPPTFGHKAAEGPLSPAEGTYLYEPNASVMKAGCFAELAARFGVSPISCNSHLFLSATLSDDFPGRKFSITAMASMNKRDLKEKVMPLRQANITVRNFPLSVAELRKRLKLAEGGASYLFATTLADGSHVLLVCQRVG